MKLFSPALFVFTLAPAFGAVGDAPIWTAPAVPATGWIELLPDVWHRGSFIPGCEPQL